jgi:DNA-binding NtrC family response regulator
VSELPVVLVVDDEENIRFAVRGYLERRKLAVLEADSVSSARRLASERAPDAAVIDWRLPDGTGLDLLRELRKLDEHLPVIVLTGHGTIELAVRALRDGAEHFLTKPLDLEALHAIIERAIGVRRERLAARLAENRHRRDAVDPFFGESAAIRRLASQAARVAEAAVPVLIVGETGSGKGVLARWLHDRSPRAREPFVDLNCAGLPRELVESELFGHERGAFTGAVTTKPGLFEVASRGTLFLDEIGDLPAELQPRLLKVVEEKTFRRLGDVQVRRSGARLLAATHQDLERQARDGRFRADLFYRLSTVTLRVPPLRERGRDVVALAEAMLLRLGDELGKTAPTLGPSAVAALTEYSWPGNVRELRNVLERTLLLRDAQTLDAGDLDLGVSPEPETPPIQTLREVERRHIERTLAALGGNVEQAARRLGLSRSSLYERLQRLGIPTHRRSRSSGNPENSSSESPDPEARDD